MADQLELLAGAAADLATAAATRPEIASSARRLASRLSRRRFHVSVLGEFKRGKSTLINAMVGQDVMPSGVLPLTSVTTELSYGPPGATVNYLDGTTQEITLHSLATYVTETANPGNERKVAHVEARAPAELLRPGVVLVDTPGTGSVFGHDEVAGRALLEADGAIVVMSADAPLSAQERKLLAALSKRKAPTFYVLNRIDHLSAPERDEVSRFVAQAVEKELGHPERLWCLSARAALTSRLAGTEPVESSAGDFGAFSAAFDRFVAQDLVHARTDTARRELRRLARELEGSLALEKAAAALDAASLAQRVATLRAAASDQRNAFEDERTLLDRDVAELADGIERSLAGFAAEQVSRWDSQLVDVARTAPVGRLEDDLRSAVESAVRQSFDQFRMAEADEAEQAWRRLAERLRDRAQGRVDAVRAAAADIFQVELPELAVPQVAEEREHFFYIFVHVGSSTEGITRLVRRALPPALARRRLLERARHDLAAELDKHAGRARWDLTQRLDAVCRRFEAAMAAEIDHSIETILAAAQRAEELHDLAEAQLQARMQDDRAAGQAARAALHVAAQTEQ